MPHELPKGLPLETQELAELMLTKFLESMPEIGIRIDCPNERKIVNVAYRGNVRDYIVHSFASWMEAEFDEIAALAEPYTLEQVRELKDEDGWINGYIYMDLCEVIDHDLEWFLDEISERLVGSPLLMEVSYKTVSVKDETLLVYVEGKTEALFEDEEE